ncbi:unnamed protein product [Schistosoma mattheei]|uniref:Uncharacterized protein n=1 Tax=Schistosoma mattheei TaxID=31246 RepID=A0A183P3B5_9TREM|nr:unnamed protein product [Schistosoma mattheei]
MKPKLNKHWIAGETALQRFTTAFRRGANKFKINQQQVPSLTRSTERRNYYRGQLEWDPRSTNFNMLRGSGPQEASS